MKGVETCPNCNKKFSISQVASKVPESNGEGKVFCPNCKAHVGQHEGVNPGSFTVTDPYPPKK